MTVLLHCVGHRLTECKYQPHVFHSVALDVNCRERVKPWASRDLSECVLFDMSWPRQGSRPLTHRELSELFPFGSGSDWAKAFFWPSVSVYERVIGVCKSYSCHFLILEAYSWRLRPCKHILLRLANPPSPELYIINMLMSRFVVGITPSVSAQSTCPQLFGVSGLSPFPPYP